MEQSRLISEDEIGSFIPPGKGAEPIAGLACFNVNSFSVVFSQKASLIDAQEVRGSIVLECEREITTTGYIYELLTSSLKLYRLNGQR